jgi:amino-acid N-acetyltransferase
MYTLIKAEVKDLPEINRLLNSEQLPQVDPDEFTAYYFKSSNEKGQINGAIGLEIYGMYGLLRSLVVDKNFRNQGIANLLVNQVISISRDIRLKEVYLLTSTAENYFLKKEFKPADRKQAPEEIKACKEYSSICPSTSMLMKISI